MGEIMKNLKTLHEKLEEYNRAENEHWMILIDGTRFDFVFIVDSDDITKYPSWWPITDVAETIESVLELVPKEETFRLAAYREQGRQLPLGRNIAKSKIKQIIDLLGH